METIYLVLIANTKEICFASFNQYTAQQMCHKAAKLAKSPCEVKRENFYNLPVEVRDELISTSKAIREHVGKITQCRVKTHCKKRVSANLPTVRE